MQGDMLVGFIGLRCKFSFLFVVVGIHLQQKLRAFPRVLSVPCEVLRSTVRISAAERCGGSLWDGQRRRTLLHCGSQRQPLLSLSDQPPARSSAPLTPCGLHSIHPSLSGTHTAFRFSNTVRVERKKICIHIYGLPL